MKYIRLYIDEQGESHFGEADIELQAIPDVSPALHISASQQATHTQFMVASPGWRNDWHTVSQRLLVIVLAGELEAEVSDGEKRCLSAGVVSICEDTHGKGHRARVVGNVPCVMALVNLA